MVFLLLSVTICYACEEKTDEIRTEGEVTISSEILGTEVYYVNGFSFEEDKFVRSLNSGPDVPDIIPENILEVSGEVIGMALSTGPGNHFGFYKNFESNDLSEAENFWLNYLEVDVESFISLSDTLSPGQVYTFRTYKENFVKFLVKDVRVFSEYVEANIRFSIQRDGSAIFDE